MQTIPMQLSFGEGNPFTDITGGFSSLLKKLVDVIAGLSCHAESEARQGDAVTDDFPENVLVCTELPHDQASGHAYLSDYFYIWLRRSLRHIYPDLFRQTVTQKDEFSAVSERYGETPDATRTEYARELGQVCEKLFACASDRYPALIFYE